jgi:hypothetical protein
MSDNATSPPLSSTSTASGGTDHDTIHGNGNGHNNNGSGMDSNESSPAPTNDASSRMMKINLLQVRIDAQYHWMSYMSMYGIHRQHYQTECVLNKYYSHMVIHYTEHSVTKTWITDIRPMCLSIDV